MGSFCGKCGNQLAEGVKFCPVCGNPVQQLSPVQKNVFQQNDFPEYPATGTQRTAYTEQKNPQFGGQYNGWYDGQNSGFPEDDVFGQGSYQTPPNPQPLKQPKKRPKIKLGWIIGGAVALVAVIVLIVVLRINASTIKLNDYVEITTYGYDGYGTASVTFDTDRFETDHEDKFPRRNREMSMAAFEAVFYNGVLSPSSELANGDTVTYEWDDDIDELAEQYDLRVRYSDIEQRVEDLEAVDTVDLFDYVSLSFTGINGYGTAVLDVDDRFPYDTEVYFEASITEGLSNGDEVTVYARANDWSSTDLTTYFIQSYGKAPESLEKTFTVDGLGEGESFDPFDYIELSIEGISPEGRLSCNIKEQAGIMDGVTADISQTSDLANGDEVTVTLTYEYDNDDTALRNRWAEQGMIPTATQKTYTVEGLMEYVAKLDQITDDALSSMKSQTEDTFRSNVASDWEYPDSLVGMNYLGAYLLTPKSGDFYVNHENVVYMVYSIDVGPVTEYGESYDGFTYYYFTAFYDLTATDDYCDVNISSYNKANSGFKGPNTLYYRGFKTLDALYSSCVTENLEKYNYESSVSE